ncbi:YcxB family protein [Luteibacter aegosomatissinici]|uniref:YcxB family protein n=1 Tax=Luteibacter aegosomatissinici TaxID=2911539 RepID=UPI001FF965DD|nr:YcxB family protein [Luteibacter aegosomatissinici]UPG94665.1 YcxB family protein [Luteibacter aegosomatissinici]
MAQDILIIRCDRTLSGLRRSVLGMYRWLPDGVLLLATTILMAAMCLSDHGRNPLLNWMPMLVFIAVMLALVVPRYLKIARKLYLQSREHGPPEFTVTAERIRCDNAGNSADLKWDSVHSVCVSPHTLYIFVNRRCAWFVPRGAHDERFLAMVRKANVRVRGPKGRI